MKIFRKRESRCGLYDTARLYMVVTDNIESAIKSLEVFKDTDNPDEDPNDCRAYSFCSWPHYAVLLKDKLVNKRSIAHEIFHVTHKLMHDIGDVFERGHDEPYAYLNDWLTGWAYRELHKMGIRNIPIDKPRRSK